MITSLKFSQFGISTLLLCLLTIGCGGGDEQVPVGEVEGTVTVNDEPLADGSISFYDAATGNSAGGAIVNGKFKFTEPVPAGTYKVAIRPPDAPQPDDEESGKLASAAHIIPDGYRDDSTSGLVATIAEGPNSLEFELSEDGPSQTPSDESPP
jgi:hypothetical protein